MCLEFHIFIDATRDFQSLRQCHIPAFEWLAAFLCCVVVDEESMFETKGRPTWNELPWWTKAALIIGPIAGALVIFLHFLNR
jgi:hypothetical protein